MRKVKKSNNLIPKVPFTIDEMNVLLESKGNDKSLQQKLLDYSRSDAYKFLSNLTLDNIAKPLPGVKLSRKQLQLFNEFVKYKASLDYQVFQVIERLVIDYHANLRVKTIKEDFGEKFKFTNETNGNITVIGVTEVESPKKYRSSLPGVA